MTTARLKASSEELREFDHILHENSDGLDRLINSGYHSSRRIAISLGSSRDPQQTSQGSSCTVLMASSATAVAAPSGLQEELIGSSVSDSIVTTSEGGATSLSQTDDDDDDPFDSALESAAKMSKIQQIQERPPTVSARLKKMDLQDIVLTLILPSIALYAAGRFVYNKVADRVQTRTDSFLDAFAREMIYHDGDFDEMNMCIKDFRGKLVYLGPTRNDRMLKSYLEAYAKRKTISPQAISSLSYVFTLFGLSEESAARVLVSLCREMGTDKIASAGKLLFLGSRILKSPEGIQALRPIKELIKSTYREATVAEEMVETSQQYVSGSVCLDHEFEGLVALIWLSLRILLALLRCYLICHCEYHKIYG
jgi:hypothetical protein